MSATKGLVPHSSDMERALIYCIIEGGNATMSELVGNVKFQDFHFERNRCIYESCARLFMRKLPIDYSTILEDLRTSGALEGAGGETYLYETARMDGVLTNNVLGYATAIKRLATRRRLQHAGDYLKELALIKDEKLDWAVDQAQLEANLVVSAHHEKQSRSHDAYAAASIVRDEALKWAGDPQDIRGMASGLYPYDYAIGGLEKHLLYFLMARPGMGKSSLLAQATTGYSRAGKGVLIFSFEMTTAAFTRRMACQIAHVKNDDVKRGQMDKDSADRFYAALDEIAKMSFVIEERSGIAVPTIESVVRRIASDQQIDIVIIDTINKIKSEGGSPYERMTNTSNGLAEMAHNNDYALLCAAQVNRKNTETSDKRPTLADFRDSGALEQDVDVAFSLHRPFYYEPDRKDLEHLAEIWVLKARDGESMNKAELYWDGPSMSFARLHKTEHDLGDMINDAPDGRYVAGRADSKTDN